MTVEIRTTGVKPLRNAFAHLEKRFGDKPATRYQEIAYDTQPTVNFHSRLLRDPEQHAGAAVSEVGGTTTRAPA